jgi:aconitate decarboxylase
VLESEYGGFCTTFSRSTDRFDLKELTAGFGTTWQTMGVALKFYACVGSNHTTLDALRDMQAERPFGRGREKVVVHGSQVTMDHVGWKYVPQGLTSAQLNLPYCVATWLLEGDCGVDQFTEDKVADPQRIAHSREGGGAARPDITARGAKFRTWCASRCLKDGTRLERTVEAARGSEHRSPPSRHRREVRESCAQRAAARSIRTAARCGAQPRPARRCHGHRTPPFPRVIELRVRRG